MACVADIAELMLFVPGCAEFGAYIQINYFVALSHMIMLSRFCDLLYYAVPLHHYGPLIMNCLITLLFGTYLLATQRRIYDTIE
jgi:hypothetical protein